MKEIVLPSGAILKISNTPFAESKGLYQAVLEEMKQLKMSSSADMAALMKDVFCLGFSSKKIESALNVCLKRCLYNELKIDESTFEPMEARADYTTVCIEVIQFNITPFTKGLYAEFGRILSMITSVQT